MKKMFALFLVIVMLFVMPVPAYAAEAIGKVEAFENMPPGDGKYINKKDFYYLDMVKPGLTEPDIKMANGLANGIFGFEVRMVDLTCSIMYHATTIDFMELIGGQVDEVQGNLYNNLFKAAFNLAFLFAGLFMSWLLLGRKFAEIFDQLAKVAVICFLAVLLSSNTSWIIKMDDELTQSISGLVASAMFGDEDTSSSYAVGVAGKLWETQIHEPWKTLQFGEYSPDNEEDIIKKLLTTPKKSEDRQKYIKDLNDDDSKAFNKDMGGERIIFSILYFFPLMVKCLVVDAIVVLQLAFRVIKIFLYLLGMPIMLLAIIPSLGGIKLIGTWFKNIVEMSIMIVVLSASLSILLWFDDILWTYVAQLGWLVVIVLQVVVAVVLFVFRNKILGFFDTVQTFARNPQMASWEMQWKLQQMSNTGSVFQHAQKVDKQVTQAVVSTTTAAIGGAAGYAGSGVSAIMQSWNSGAATPTNAAAAIAHKVYSGGGSGAAPKEKPNDGPRLSDLKVIYGGLSSGNNINNDSGKNSNSSVKDNNDWPERQYRSGTSYGSSLGELKVKAGATDWAASAVANSNTGNEPPAAQKTNPVKLSDLAAGQKLNA